MISDLTYKIAAYSEIPNFNPDDCVDWANEMLSLGYETENLIILSALTKPANYFESIEYLNSCFTELEFNFKNGLEAIISYSNYLLKSIAKKNNVRNNLKILKDINLEKEYENEVYDFILLYWAWSDLEYGNKNQEYWKTATIESIENIIINKAKLWVEKKH